MCGFVSIDFSITKNLFSLGMKGTEDDNTVIERSVDSLYSILDDITFISPDILHEPYFERLLGTSATNGILIIANSLLLGFLIYFSAKYLLSHFYLES